MQILADAPTSSEMVCLPWGCEWREHCRRNMELRGVVIITYFHPPHVGEHCPYYERINRDDLA